ncbi:MAG: leucyl/phenylalanyl-tRNA--protein transferase [Verrucomicrobiota bacterium]
MSEFSHRNVLPPQVLLGAYAQGVFPMADRGEIVWFSPLRRGVIPIDERFHVPHGLKRALRKAPFELRWNTAFREVMEGCAQRNETWIDEVILESYCLLHDWGYAHSVECWDEDGLQGGLYGVAMGRAFFGESMFSRKPDASKIALVDLVGGMRASGFELLDTQWITPHLRQFGAEEIPREEYHRRLVAALDEQDPASIKPPVLGPQSSSSNRDE